jgi:endonuclease YncB( thermonuclease family)
MVARCFVRGRDLGAMMVAGGWAIDYAYFSKGFYSAAQDQAKQARRGVWARR